MQRNKEFHLPLPYCFHSARKRLRWFHRARETHPSLTQEDSISLTLIPLNGLATGKRGIVRQISGGKHFNNRIYELGFLPGSEITMLENYGHGPVLVCIRDTRVALGNKEAAKILVEVTNGAEEK